MTQISMACRRIRKKRCASVRELARLIGKMTATLPAVFPAPLWYRELQHLKNQTYQRSQSFECMVTLSQEALLELDWWSVERNLMNGKSVITQDSDLTMETDASMLGWGAVCQGIRTGGLWSQAERRSHINYLELLAAWFGVRAFARDKRNIHIHLKMDNSTAVFYVNRMGGTRSPVLSNLAIQLWQWCLERNLSITAEHLPGVDNVVADEESRVIQSTAEWQLHCPIFQQILECLSNCNIRRSVRNSPQCSIETVCELETRPRLNGSRWPTTTVEQVEVIRLSTFLPDWQMCQEGQGRQSIPDTNSPSLEISTMVPSIAGAVGRLSSNTSTITNAPVGPIRQTSSLNGDRTATASRLETIRHRQQAEGISSEASQLLAAGWSRGTNSTYECAWRRWDSWCSERQVDPISCAIQPFLEFLTGLFKEGLQYRTINTYHKICYLNDS